MRGERSSWKLDADGRPPPHFSGSTCSQLGTWVHYLARAGAACLTPLALRPCEQRLELAR